jgi:hypothetical protein
MAALKAVARLAPNVIKVMLPLNGDNVDQNVFICDRPYVLEYVAESHATAGTDAGAVTLVVRKCTGTQAVTSGTSLQVTSIDLKGTANTVQVRSVPNGGLVAEATRTFTTGDRVALDFTGTITALAGTCVTIVMRPVTGVLGR